MIYKSCARFDVETRTKQLDIIFWEFDRPTTWLSSSLLFFVFFWYSLTRTDFSRFSIWLVGPVIGRWLTGGDDDDDPFPSPGRTCELGKNSVTQPERSKKQKQNTTGRPLHHRGRAPVDSSGPFRVVIGYRFPVRRFSRLGSVKENAALPNQHNQRNKKKTTTTMKSSDGGAFTLIGYWKGDRLENDGPSKNKNKKQSDRGGNGHAPQRRPSCRRIDWPVLEPVDSGTD